MHRIQNRVLSTATSGFAALALLLSSCKDLSEDLVIVDSTTGQLSHLTTDAGTTTSSSSSPTVSTTTEVHTRSAPTTQGTSTATARTSSPPTSSSDPVTSSSSIETSTSSEKNSSGTGTGSTSPDAAGSTSAPAKGMTFAIETPEYVYAESKALRLMIAQIELTSVPGGATISVKRVAWDYPIDPTPLAAGAPIRVILPEQDPSQLNKELGRGPLYMLALYQDLDANLRWDPTDTSLGASPNILFFELPTQTQGPNWSTWSNYANAQALLSTPVSELKETDKQTLSSESKIPVVSLGSSAPDAAVGGAFEALDPRTSFISALSTSEISNLPQAFQPGPRSLDAAIRVANDGKRWTIPSSELPAISEANWASLAIPGIRADAVYARALVSYRRPIGAPIPGPGQFLTADAELLSGLCDQQAKNYAILRWLDPSDTGWLTERSGLFQAGALGLQYGWTWGLVSELAPAPTGPILTTPDSLTNLAAKSGECPLPQQDQTISPTEAIQ